MSSLASTLVAFLFALSVLVFIHELGHYLVARWCGVKVLRERDYDTGKVIVPGLGAVDKTEISGSNVLYFELEDDTSFIVRPSGTEPKIKIYLLVRGEDKSACAARIDKYAAYAQSLK